MNSLVDCTWENYYHPFHRKPLVFPLLCPEAYRYCLFRQREALECKLWKRKRRKEKVTKRSDHVSFHAERWLHKIGFTSINWKINSKLPLRVPVGTLLSLESLFLKGWSLNTEYYNQDINWHPFLTFILLFNTSSLISSIVSSKMFLQPKLAKVLSWVMFLRNKAWDKNFGAYDLLRVSSPDERNEGSRERGKWEHNLSWSCLWLDPMKSSWAWIASEAFIHHVNPSSIADCSC